MPNTNCHVELWSCEVEIGLPPYPHPLHVAMLLACRLYRIVLFRAMDATALEALCNVLKVVCTKWTLHIKIASRHTVKDHVHCLRVWVTSLLRNHVASALLHSTRMESTSNSWSEDINHRRCLHTMWCEVYMQHLFRYIKTTYSRPQQRSGQPILLCTNTEEKTVNQQRSWRTRQLLPTHVVRRGYY